MLIVYKNRLCVPIFLGKNYSFTSFRFHFLSSHVEIIVPPSSSSSQLTRDYISKYMSQKINCLTAKLSHLEGKQILANHFEWRHRRFREWEDHAATPDRWLPERNTHIWLEWMDNTLCSIFTITMDQRRPTFRKGTKFIGHENMLI